MIDLLVPGNGVAAPVLRVRGPAYGVIAECLRIQSDARPQSRLAMVFGLNPVQPDARSWYRGAVGEIRVAKMLKLRADGSTLLHAVADGASTGTAESPGASHLVIGPGGVFVIATKNHAGERVSLDAETLRVNGHRTDHLREARFEATRVSRLLSSGVGGVVDVTPIIAIVDPGSLSYSRPRPRDVVVIASSRLASALSHGTQHWWPSMVSALVAAAEDGGSWRRDAEVLDDTLRHEARFVRLRHHVRMAAWRRALWIVLGVLAALAAVPLAFAL